MSSVLKRSVVFYCGFSVCNLLFFMSNSSFGMFPNPFKAQAPSIVSSMASSAGNLSVGSNSEQPRDIVAVHCNLESFTTKLPPDILEHVVRSFSSDLEEVRVLLMYETRLAGARPRTYVISGDAHSGREDAILAMAGLFNRKARLIPLKILLERYREQAYPTLENLIEQASHCEEKSFFICKDFDELDQAYESQWKKTFKNSPTISIWNAFERIGNMNPNVTFFCTTQRPLMYPNLTIVEKSVESEIIYAEQHGDQPDILIARAERVLAFLTYHLKKNNFNIIDHHIAPLALALSKIKYEAIQAVAERLMQKATTRRGGNGVIVLSDLAIIMNEAIDRAKRSRGVPLEDGLLKDPYFIRDMLNTFRIHCADELSMYDLFKFPFCYFLCTTDRALVRGNEPLCKAYNAFMQRSSDKTTTQ